MRLLILTISIFLSSLTFGQTVYKPTIVILDPYQKKYDTTLKIEIAEFNRNDHPTPKEEKKYFESLKTKQKNIQIMDSAEWVFRKKMGFSSMFTLALYGMLSYSISGETDKAVIFPSHDTSSGQINSLKALAKKHRVLWVVNPFSLRTYQKGRNKYTTVRLQVYDAQKDKIVLDKEYTGDTKNPGFELSCKDGTLECTVNNVLNPSVNDILLTILGNYQH